MKNVLSLLFAVIVLECVLAGPVPETNNGAEEKDSGEKVTQDKTNVDDFANDFKGVISTDVGYPFLQPVPHPFFFNFGFPDSFEQIFRRLHSSLWPLTMSESDDKDDSSDSVGFDFGKLPKNGTTSTVKIVDGHKIEVNESSYGDQNSLFKVRVVNIRPVQPKEGEEAKPVNDITTSGPTVEKKPNDSEERREPLEKHTSENEVVDIDNNTS